MYNKLEWEIARHYKSSPTGRHRRLSSQTSAGERHAQEATASTTEANTADPAGGLLTAEDLQGAAYNTDKFSAVLHDKVREHFYQDARRVLFPAVARCPRYWPGAAPSM